MEKEERNIGIRIFSLVLWLPAFYILTNMIVGGVVGVVAGSSTTTYDAGYQAGQLASREFFATYGIFVVIVQIALFSALAYFGKLPGVSKYK